MDKYTHFQEMFCKEAEPQTISLYYKSFINNSIVNKIKYIYWFNYKIVTGSQKNNK